MSQKIQTFRVEENLPALIPIGNLWSPDLQTWLSRSTIPMDFTCRIKRGKNHWFTYSKVPNKRGVRITG